MIPLRTAFALILSGAIGSALALTALDMTTEQRLGLLTALVAVDLALIGFDYRARDRHD